jgi:hypothetical protein
VPPTLPADVTLTPTEQSILDMLGTDYGTSTASILAYFPMNGYRALVHLQHLAQVAAIPVPTAVGPTVMWYRAL